MPTEKACLSFWDRGHFRFVHCYDSSACSVLGENLMNHWVRLWRSFTSSCVLLYVVHLCVCVCETSTARGALVLLRVLADRYYPGLRERESQER